LGKHGSTVGSDGDALDIESISAMRADKI